MSLYPDEITTQAPESDSGPIEFNNIVCDHAYGEYEDIDGPRSNCILLQPTDFRSKDYINQPPNPRDMNRYGIPLQTLPRVN